MKVKGTAIGRLTQSLEIYRKNFFSLTIAYFLLLAVFQYIFGIYSKTSLFLNFDTGLESGIAGLYSPELMIGIALSMIGFLIVSFFVLPVRAATIRGVQQAYLSKTVTTQENFMFGMRNVLGIFKTYYYIFLYVAAIPVAFLILGLIILLLSTYLSNSLLGVVGGGVIFLSLIVLTVFSIYRGVKAKFAIYNAVSKSEFSNINFKESVELTAYQWLRIVGNMVLFTVCFWVFSKIILLFASLLGAQAAFDIRDVLEQFIESYFVNTVASWDESLGLTVLGMPELLINSFKGISEMSVGGYIRSFISSLLNVFGTVLGIIYFFLLFKILQIDNGEAELEIDNASGRKMNDHNPQVSKNERGMIEEL